MDVKNYLISTHGLSVEEAAVIADNPKYAAIYEKAAREAEDGKTALLKAQEVEKSLKDWNATQVVPYVQKADKAVADAQAKIAAQATYLKTLKDQGYDIPDSYLDGSAPPPSPPQPRWNPWPTPRTTSY
jgi:Asp-tRNA(Asn)/Glu-tRNA(Gln) amidotransferase B subunit